MKKHEHEKRIRFPGQYTYNGNGSSKILINRKTF